MKRREFLKELKAMQTDGKSAKQLYAEISAAAMKYLTPDWKPYAKRSAYYFSVEFLMGRLFYNNLMELGVADEVKEILARKGVDIHIFEEVEDAALGNGGLGRLAACFLDSAAGLGVPLYGYGIRYKYGLFRQEFRDGYQIELPDDWQAWGDPWSVRKERESRVVHFADFDAVAVPYDTPVIGRRVNTLRLYQAEGCAEAEKISEYLYPADDTQEGKLLRIRQEYFFSAAAVGELVDKFVQAHGKYFRRFANYHSIQLNDTHPVMAVAELIRILTKEHGVGFAEAVRIAKRTFNYTNHTILPEALECWDYKLIERILPDIAAIFRRLQLCAAREWKKLGCTEREAEEMAIVQSGRGERRRRDPFRDPQKRGVRGGVSALSRQIPEQNERRDAAPLADAVQCGAVRSVRSLCGGLAQGYDGNRAGRYGRSRRAARIYLRQAGEEKGAFALYQRKRGDRTA